jgi:hypothetical protein
MVRFNVRTLVDRRRYPGEIAAIAGFEKTADRGAWILAAQRIGLSGLGSQGKREEECGR